MEKLSCRRRELEPSVHLYLLLSTWYVAVHVQFCFNIEIYYMFTSVVCIPARIRWYFEWWILIKQILTESLTCWFLCLSAWIGGHPDVQWRYVHGRQHRDKSTGFWRRRSAIASGICRCVCSSRVHCDDDIGNCRLGGFCYRGRRVGIGRRIRLQRRREDDRHWRRTHLRRLSSVSYRFIVLLSDVI